MPGMRERGFGRVVNVVSTSVREPIATLMLSNSHRAAMVTAFKTIARHVAADGVTLNSVLPGRIATDRQRDAGGSMEAAERTPAPRSRPAGWARWRSSPPRPSSVLGARELHHGRDARGGRRPDPLDLSTPSGIRTRDLLRERQASWAARPWGRTSDSGRAATLRGRL